MNVIMAILGMCLVVVFHELGHLIGARACGIRSREMRIGIGKRIIWRKKIAKTEVSLTPWVVMGFLYYYPEDCDERTNPHDPLSYKLWYKRLIAYASGPAVSLLLGIILIFLAARLYGLPDYTKMVVARVVPSSPAYNAGVKVGDRLVMLNGQKISTGSNNNFSVKIVVVSRGKEREIPVSIDAMTGMDITPVIVSWTGLDELWKIIQAMVASIKLTRLSDNRTQIAGPLTCLALLSQQYTLCGYLHMLGAISFGLGLANLVFPLPMLDGSRILMALLEGAMRRPLAKGTYTLIYSAGGFLSLSVIAVVAYEVWKILIP